MLHISNSSLGSGQVAGYRGKAKPRKRPAAAAEATSPAADPAASVAPSTPKKKTKKVTTVVADGIDLAAHLAIDVGMPTAVD